MLMLMPCCLDGCQAGWLGRCRLKATAPHTTNNNANNPIPSLNAHSIMLMHTCSHTCLYPPGVFNLLTRALFAPTQVTQAIDKRRTAPERELHGGLRVLARHLPQDQFEALAEGIAVRRQLCCTYASLNFPALLSLGCLGVLLEASLIGSHFLSAVVQAWRVEAGGVLACLASCLALALLESL